MLIQHEVDEPEEKKIPYAESESPLLMNDVKPDFEVKDADVPVSDL